MEKLVALCKNRGFIYPGSDIYGGLANSWDYGPLGVELKNNIKRAWWRKFVQESPYNVGLDAAILMNREVWVASGHVGGFADPLIDCKSCKARFRADNLIEDYLKKEAGSGAAGGSGGGAADIGPVDGWPHEKMEAFIAERGIKCPTCGKSDFTGIRQFNLMFRTHAGVTEDSQNEIYMRPETAQGIFVNFRNVQRTSRRKIPFGIAQVGKSFRNEITPGNFIFRTREFEQMELEFFCAPGTDLEWFDYWKKYCHDFLLSLGMKEENIRLRDHSAEELSHYSNATTDIEFLFPFGWGELWGVADRTDFDLKQHIEHSGKDLSYQDPETNEKYVPYCIEPSLGADRILLAFLVNAYEEEDLGGDESATDDSRTVLRLHPALAPYKAAVLPLTKKQAERASELHSELSKHFMCDYDVSGNIGKRYRRQDEAGTPFCVTVDFDTEEDGAVTIRDRDTMEQVRVPLGEIHGFIESRLDF
jgi:glycyl-tRNA synthetase